MNKEDYYSVSEVAEIYGVTKVTIRNWIKSGLSYKKEKVIGKKIRKVIRPKDIDSFISVGYVNE